MRRAARAERSSPVPDAGGRLSRCFSLSAREHDRLGRGIRVASVCRLTSQELAIWLSTALQLSERWRPFSARVGASCARHFRRYVHVLILFSAFNPYLEAITRDRTGDNLFAVDLDLLLIATTSSALCWPAARHRWHLQQRRHQSRRRSRPSKCATAKVQQIHVLGALPSHVSEFCSILVCSFPLEYCEFGSSFTKCKDVLKEDDPDLYNRYYSEGEDESVLSILAC